ncbi:MAG: GNAT family N-acetyltransferase, partial [Candidatus Omnitrophica bacterium]|nr:GNAT family N-acetyltransferase [Candidatus Omnitrophota bacterium]
MQQKLGQKKEKGFTKDVNKSGGAGGRVNLGLLLPVSLAAFFALGAEKVFAAGAHLAQVQPTGPPAVSPLAWFGVNSQADSISPCLVFLIALFFFAAIPTVIYVRCFLRKRILSVWQAGIPNGVYDKEKIIRYYPNYLNKFTKAMKIIYNLALSDAGAQWIIKVYQKDLQNYHVFFAVEESRIVGFIQFDVEENTLGTIKRLAVLPDSQRKGIGSALMDSAANTFWNTSPKVIQFVFTPRPGSGYFYNKYFPARAKGHCLRSRWYLELQQSVKLPYKALIQSNENMGSPAQSSNETRGGAGSNNNLTKEGTSSLTKAHKKATEKLSLPFLVLFKDVFSAAEMPNEKGRERKARLEQIAADFLKEHPEKKKILLTELSDLAGIKYCTVWRWVKNNGIILEGVSSVEKGSKVSLGKFIVAAEEVAVDKKSKEFPLMEIRDKMKMKKHPSTFSNMLARLRKAGIDPIEELLKIGISATLPETGVRKTSPKIESLSAQIREALLKFKAGNFVSKEELNQEGKNIRDPLVELRKEITGGNFIKLRRECNVILAEKKKQLKNEVTIKEKKAQQKAMGAPQLKIQAKQDEADKAPEVEQPKTTPKTDKLKVAKRLKTVSGPIDSRGDDFSIPRCERIFGKLDRTKYIRKIALYHNDLHEKTISEIIEFVVRIEDWPLLIYLLRQAIRDNTAVEGAFFYAQRALIDAAEKENHPLRKVSFTTMCYCPEPDNIVGKTEDLLAKPTKSQKTISEPPEKSIRKSEPEQEFEELMQQFHQALAKSDKVRVADIIGQMEGLKADGRLAEGQDQQIEDCNDKLRQLYEDTGPLSAPGFFESDQDLCLNITYAFWRNFLPNTPKRIISSLAAFTPWEILLSWILPPSLFVRMHPYENKRARSSRLLGAHNIFCSSWFSFFVCLSGDLLIGRVYFLSLKTHILLLIFPVVIANISTHLIHNIRNPDACLTLKNYTLWITAALTIAAYIRLYLGKKYSRIFFFISSCFLSVSMLWVLWPKLELVSALKNYAEGFEFYSTLGMLLSPFALILWAVIYLIMPTPQGLSTSESSGIDSNSPAQPSNKNSGGAGRVFPSGMSPITSANGTSPSTCNGAANNAGERGQLESPPESKKVSGLQQINVRKIREFLCSIQKRFHQVCESNIHDFPAYCCTEGAIILALVLRLYFDLKIFNGEEGTYGIDLVSAKIKGDDVDSPEYEDHMFLKLWLGTDGIYYADSTLCQFDCDYNDKIALKEYETAVKELGFYDEQLLDFASFMEEIDCEPRAVKKILAEILGISIPVEFSLNDIAFNDKALRQILLRNGQTVSRKPQGIRGNAGKKEKGLGEVCTMLGVACLGLVIGATILPSIASAANRYLATAQPAGPSVQEIIASSLLVQIGISILIVGVLIALVLII